jgi:hypothetical protein
MVEPERHPLLGNSVENTVSMTMITHATREEQLETVLGLYNK